MTTFSPLVIPARAFSWSRASVARAPESAFSGLTKAIACAVVFIAGWYLCLPESDVVQMPWWAAKHKFGPNLLVFEAVFAAYLVAGGLAYLWRSVIPARYATFPAAAFLTLLAVWCGLTSLLGPLPLHDAGRSARLVFLVLLMLAATSWAARDPLFVLRSFLLGLMGASIVTLVMTFLNPIILAAGSIPRLLGQNAPGPPMGIGVGLAAWLILLSRNRRDTILAVAAAMIFGVAVMLSYSKTGMFAAAMGFVSLVAVSGKVAGSRRGGVLLSIGFVVLLSLVGYLRSEGGQQVSVGLVQMLTEKLASAGSESTSVQERWSYYQGVGEIITKHPIGVGYSGFRDAMLDTDAYRSGAAADDSVSDIEQANPHALFLYYASAGGMVAAVLCVAGFLLLCWSLFSGLELYGLTGLLLAACSAVAFFVMGTSVPYLFNSTVMLIPAAISAGVRARVIAGANTDERFSTLAEPS